MIAAALAAVLIASLGLGGRIIDRREADESTDARARRAARGRAMLMKLRPPRAIVDPEPVFAPPPPELELPPWIDAELPTGPPPPPTDRPPGVPSPP